MTIKRNNRHRSPRAALAVRGYAYVEVLIAAMVLSIALVPAVDALRQVVVNIADQRASVSARFEALALMETVLIEPFATLEAEANNTGGLVASTYSDAPGTVQRRIVYVAPHDIDNADGDDNVLTGTDVGVVRIQAQVENTGIVLETLVGRST